MLITEVFAMAPPGEGGDGSGGMSTMIMFAAMFAIIYFLMIRPQQKRNKEHKAMLDGIQKNEKVITSSGVHGKIVEYTDNTVKLEVAQNVIMTFEKTAIANKKS